MRDYLYCVLVTGGRDYEDKAKVWQCLDTVLFLHGDVMLITGACPAGADYHAEQWAKAREQVYVGFPAEWLKYKKRAGPKRNAEMGAMSQAQQIIAFRGGHGTLSMLGIAYNMTDPVPMIWLPDGEFWK